MIDIIWLLEYTILGLGHLLGLKGAVKEYCQLILSINKDDKDKKWSQSQWHFRELQTFLNLINLGGGFHFQGMVDYLVAPYGDIIGRLFP
ncbi:MAG TPA: hypothetical protein GXX25_04150 [Desulfotomaculum sp.]|nr:hypothetical protein [Desulfotomaculum sp.]